MVSPSTSFLSVSGMDTSGETVGRKGKESFFNYLKKLYLNRVMIYDLVFFRFKMFGLDNESLFQCQATRFIYRHKTTCRLVIPEDIKY